MCYMCSVFGVHAVCLCTLSNRQWWLSTFHKSSNKRFKQQIQSHDHIYDSDNLSNVPAEQSESTLKKPVLTFAWWEKAVHFHTAARVRDAQSAAGDQTLLRRSLVCGPHQTPARPVTGPLQQLHCLTRMDAELRGTACHKVLQDHRQLTPSRELWEREKNIFYLLSFV